jgi:hypothetical protein
MTEFKNTPEQAREALVEALTSSDYAQARNQLKTPENEFCCLGVACDLFSQMEPQADAHWIPQPMDGTPVFIVGSRTAPVNDHGEIQFTRDGSPKPHAPAAVEGSVTVLPETVRAWLGFRDNDGRFEDSPAESLAGLNDTGAGFDYIAEMIAEGRPVADD